MNPTISITLDQREATLLMQMIDGFVRANGLVVAEAALRMKMKLDEAARTPTTNNVVDMSAAKTAS